MLAALVCASFSASVSILNPETFNKAKESLAPNTILISYHTNTTGQSEETRFFFSTAVNITSFLRNGTQFAIVRSPDCPKNRFMIYYPGLEEVEVDMINITKPARAAVAILKNAAKMLYNKRRAEKESKNPEISRIKSELRVLFKQTRNIIISDEKRDELMKEIESLQDELFRHVKTVKHQIKALKIKRKTTVSSKRGPITEEINALKKKSGAIRSAEKQQRFEEKKMMKSFKVAKKQLQAHIRKENMRLIADKLKSGFKSLMDGSWAEKLTTAFEAMRDDPVEEYYDEDAGQTKREL